MQTTFREMIDYLSYEELDKLSFDVANGSTYIKHMIKKRMSELEHRHKKICAECGTDIHPYDNAYTITFGPSDFRKKASLCALDCLETFQSKLKKL